MYDRNKQISFFRQTLNLSQAALGKEIGYSQSYVRDIELGRAKPSRRFLEALNKRFGVSIDQLLIDFGERIINYVEIIPSLSGYGFVYLYDFTDKGLDEAERQLIGFLSNYNYILIEGEKIRSKNHLLSILTGQRGTLKDLSRAFEKSIRNKYKFFVFKKISSSGIKGDTKAYLLRELSKNIGLRGALIVIDKPSFLEKNAHILYYHAFPIQFVSRFGKMHY